MDDAHPKSAWDVRCGKDPVNSVDLLGGRGVDAHYVGPGMVSQAQGCMQQAVGGQVVDKRSVAET